MSSTRVLRKLLRPIAKPRIADSCSMSKHLLGKSCLKIEHDDEFRWLEDLTSEETSDYIKRENRYTNLQLWHTKIFQRKVRKYFKDLTKLIQENSHQSLSECIGQYEYFLERSESALPVVYRRPVNSPNEHHTLVLDHNELAKETEFVSVQPLKISPSQNYFAVIFNCTGTGVSDCHVFRITPRGPSLIKRLRGVSNAEWCGDDNTLIFTTSNRPGEVNEVKRYSLKKNSLESIMIENDPRFIIDLVKSRDHRYILIHSNSKKCSEVRALSANDPHLPAMCIQKREEGVECFVDHWENYFYAIRTECKDKEYQIMRMSSENPSKGWQSIYSQGNKGKRVIQDMELFSGTCVVYELNNLIPQLTTILLDKPDIPKSISASDCSAVMESFSNQDPRSTTFRYSITAPIKPLTILEFDRHTCHSKEVFKSLEGWDSSNFNFRLLEAQSKDGTNVPISIFYSKDIEDLSHAPMLVTVYGSYGVPVDLQFTNERAFLLSKGWILAFPHVRGGGELGREWYRSATKLKKKRTFEDLESCLVKLHSNSFSLPDKTALLGASAGGLAVAVLCNSAPELIKAAILKVPFVDVVSSMLKDQMNLTLQEYEEWGDVKNSMDHLLNVNSYCPYENLKYCKKFPSVYVLTNLEDDLVPAWMALKWTAKLRHLENLANNPGHQLITCRVHAKGGHFGGGEQRKDNQISEMIAFLYVTLQLPMGI